MILVIAQDGDQSADQVIQALARRGARVARVDHGRFPVAPASVRTDASGVRSTLAGSAGSFSLDRVRAAWFRSPRECRPAPALTDPAARAYASLETRELLYDLWYGLDCFWLPCPPHD